jgi:acylphosphatase
MKKRLTLNIFGKVQGVGYRYLTQKEAEKRGFFGYVKNLEDGSVVIVAEGKEEDLRNFIDWCYNAVRSAMVEKIDQDWSEATSRFYVFKIN